jgi:hypothetical protein
LALCFLFCFLSDRRRLSGFCSFFSFYYFSAWQGFGCWGSGVAAVFARFGFAWGIATVDVARRLREVCCWGVWWDCAFWVRRWQGWVVCVIIIFSEYERLGGWGSQWKTGF